MKGNARAKNQPNPFSSLSRTPPCDTHRRTHGHSIHCTSIASHGRKPAHTKRQNRPSPYRGVCRQVDHLSDSRPFSQWTDKPISLWGTVRHCEASVAPDSRLPFQPQSYKKITWQNQDIETEKKLKVKSIMDKLTFPLVLGDNKFSGYILFKILLPMLINLYKRKNSLPQMHR